MAPLRGLIACWRMVPWVAPTAKLFRPLRGEGNCHWTRVARGAANRHGLTIPTGSELSAQGCRAATTLGSRMPTVCANPEWVAAPRVALEGIDIACCGTSRIQPLQG